MRREFKNGALYLIHHCVVPLPQGEGNLIHHCVVPLLQGEGNLIHHCVVPLLQGEGNLIHHCVVPLLQGEGETRSVTDEAETLQRGKKMNEQEKKQAEELADCGGEISDENIGKAAGGALLEDYVPNGDMYIRCPSCGTADIRYIESDWTTCTYKCNSCKKKFELNTETREYKPIKSGGCS